MSDQTEDQGGDRRSAGTTRRMVLGAAWSVPVVLVGAPAPAIAASVRGILSFDTLNLYGAGYNRAGKPTLLESRVQVQNRYVAAGPTLTALTLTMTYPDTVVSGGAPNIVSGPGWSFTGATHVGATWVYRYAWTGSVPSSGSTPELQVQVPLSATAPPGTVVVSAQASATGFTSVTGNATYTL